MSKKPRENRVPIMMSDEELTSIDDWRFSNRVATRSDAVRKLVQIGLGAARNAEHLKHAIAEALHTNLTAVHLLEEKFVEPMDGPDDLIRLYSRIVGNALDALAMLNVAGQNHFDVLSPFIGGGNTFEDALEEMGYRADEIEQRRLDFEKLRELAAARRDRERSTS